MLHETKKGRRMVNKFVAQVQKLHGVELKTPDKTVVLRELAGAAYFFNHKAVCMAKADELEARGSVMFDACEAAKVEYAFRDWSRTLKRAK
jgi:predicted glycosyltransferase